MFRVIAYDKVSTSCLVDVESIESPQEAIGYAKDHDLFGKTDYELEDNLYVEVRTPDFSSVLYTTYERTAGITVDEAHHLLEVLDNHIEAQKLNKTVKEIQSRLRRFIRGERV